MRRKVRYWNDIQIEDGACYMWNGEYQVITFNNSKVGYFHAWGIVSGETVALIENYEGHIEAINPTFVKFTHENTTTPHLFEALSFIEDQETRERVINVFLNTDEYNKG
jgi:hypothetical protein